MIPWVAFDHNDVYCGNVSISSIKVALIIAAKYKLTMRGGDLVAYLVTLANQNYPVYIQVPQGYAIAPVMCIPVDEDVALEDDMGRIGESFEAHLKKLRRAISVVSNTRDINLSNLTRISQNVYFHRQRRCGSYRTPTSRTNPRLPPPVVNEDENMEVEELEILEDQYVFNKAKMLSSGTMTTSLKCSVKSMIRMMKMQIQGCYGD